MTESPVQMSLDMCMAGICSEINNYWFVLASYRYHTSHRLYINNNNKRHYFYRTNLHNNNVKYYVC